jgi:hypothetical protein
MRAVVIPRLQDVTPVTRLPGYPVTRLPRLQDASTEMGMTTRQFSEDATFLWEMVEDDKRWVSSRAWQPTKESKVQWNQADLAYPTLVERTSHKSIHERHEAATRRLRELEGSTTPGRGRKEVKERDWSSDTASLERSRSPSSPPSSAATTEVKYHAPTPITRESNHLEDDVTRGAWSESEEKGTQRTQETQETQECWFCYIKFGSSYGEEIEEEEFRIHIWEHLMEDMSFQSICPAQCGAECADRRSLAHHFFEVHQGLRTIRCRRCRETFLSEKEKEGHKCELSNSREQTGATMCSNDGVKDIKTEEAE